MPTRIIIADDETIQRMDLKDVLSKQGYLVIGEAGDGLSAVNLARELRPDLVIMDIRMPDMDGIAAAETLTQEKIAPVLLLTAFGDQPLVERAKGLLMEKQGLTEQEAFRKIQKASMNNRKSMREVAEAIILANEM